VEFVYTVVEAGLAALDERAKAADDGAVELTRWAG
jgi:hypothetical protein